MGTAAAEQTQISTLMKAARQLLVVRSYRRRVGMTFMLVPWNLRQALMEVMAPTVSTTGSGRQRRVAQRRGTTGRAEHASFDA